MPFPTGTGPDAVMRLVGERLTRIWGQQVIIDNRPGGNGFIAMTAAKRAPADGYTLVMVDYGVVSVLPHLFAKTIPYDSVKDFDAVAPMYWAYWFMAIPGDSKFTGVPDLVAEAKAKNGDYTYGSSGVGSPMHLQAATFESMTGTKMTHIPYKETPQVIADISRSDLGWAFTTGATGGPLVKAKKIRFLAGRLPSGIRVSPMCLHWPKREGRRTLTFARGSRFTRLVAFPSQCCIKSIQILRPCSRILKSGSD